MHLQKPHESVLSSPLMTRGSMSGVEAAGESPVLPGVLWCGGDSAFPHSLPASGVAPTGVKGLGQQGGMSRACFLTVSGFQRQFSLSPR